MTDKTAVVRGLEESIKKILNWPYTNINHIPDLGVTVNTYVGDIQILIVTVQNNTDQFYLLLFMYN